MLQPPGFPQILSCLCGVLQVNILPQMGKTGDNGPKSNGSNGSNGASAIPALQAK